MRLLPGRTARFEAFVAPAQAWPEAWRLVAGTLLAAAVWLAAALLIFPLARLFAVEAVRRLLLLYLASFAGLILGVALAARLLQRRGLRTLIGPDGFRLGEFGLAVAAIGGVSALGLLPILWLAPPVRQMAVVAWAAWLPLALPALLVQTAAEELAFRGWLMQGLAARFRSRAVWWLVPAALFGLMHWNTEELGRDAWLGALSAAVTGLVLADVTVRTGNLSAAIGLHFANNVVALLLISMPSPLADLSLFVMAPDPALAAPKRLLLLADIATTLAAYAAWLAVRRRLRRLHSRGAGSI